MVRLLDWLGIRRGVYLLDSHGVIYKSIVKYRFPFPDAEGRPCAWVYPFTKVGHVVLLPNGEAMQPDYIKKWRYMDETK